MVAFAFHQFFEGLSLGTSVLDSRLQSKYVISFAVIFSLTLPMGVLIGMLSVVTDTTHVALGYMNAVAAGSLLYVGLIEMTAEDFSDPSLNTQPVTKMCMFAALSLGIGVMAMLAIWS